MMPRCELTHSELKLRIFYSKTYMVNNLINLLKKLCICCLPLILVGCNTAKKDVYIGMSANQIFAQAEKNLEDEKYAQAAKDFEALEAHYPYGEHSDRAQLGIIEAYHKQNESALAVSAADRFIRMNPRHPQVDRAYYLKGLVSYNENYTFTYRYLPLDRSARDPSKMQESFDSFKELVERFPSSQYVADAKKRMVHLRDLLANHELQVVDYYVRRGAHLSAANRANYILKNFPNTTAVPEALSVMVKSYRALGMTDLANDAMQNLQSSYPNSDVLKSL